MVFLLLFRLRARLFAIFQLFVHPLDEFFELRLGFDINCNEIFEHFVVVERNAYFCLLKFVIEFSSVLTDTLYSTLFV